MGFVFYVVRHKECRFCGIETKICRSETTVSPACRTLPLELQSNSKAYEISIILTVALAAALIVVVLALVAVIIYQRWRLSDKNAAISKFINENEQLRLKMQRKGIV